MILNDHFFFFIKKNNLFSYNYIGDSVNIKNSLREYIGEQKLKIMILDNKVDIVNYDNIDHFDSNKVMIKASDKLITIKGDRLVVSRLLNDEVLVEGVINNIELR